MKFIRIAAPIAALAITGIAGANTISLASYGFYSASAVGFTSAENVDYFSAPGALSLGALTSLSENATFNNASGITSGYSSVQSYMGSGSDSVVLDLMTTSVNMNNGVYSASGNWTYANGTGSYAGLVGSGTFAASFNPAINDLKLSSLVGNLQAAPEPTSVAALAVGVIGLIARRRK